KTFPVPQYFHFVLFSEWEDGPFYPLVVYDFNLLHTAVRCNKTGGLSKKGTSVIYFFPSCFSVFKRIQYQPVPCFQRQKFLGGFVFENFQRAPVLRCRK